MGRGVDPAGGPILQRIMVQDEDVYDGRYLFTDLLDPQSLLAGPPAIGTPIEHGGNQLRLVFDRLLDPAVDVSAAVKLVGPRGEVLPALTYFDPSGVFGESSDPISTPYGPAIVLKNETPFSAGTSYALRVDAAAIRDREGDVLEADLHGSINAEYLFTTEPLYALDGMIMPDFSGPEMTIARDDYFRIETNADIGVAEVEVSNAVGERVETVAFTDCEAGARVLNIVHTARPNGERRPWETGTYSITVHNIARDASGAPLEGAFTVSDEIEPMSSFPGSCE